MQAPQLPLFSEPEGEPVRALDWRHWPLGAPAPRHSSDRPYLAALEGAPNLEALAQVVSGCQRCALRQGCQRIVFGEGTPRARLMLIGEGPGEQEDRLGRPFVGPAGQLLDRMLAAIRLSRQDVYIANVVKCRPPGNRIPDETERAACWPNLAAQLRLIQPKIVLLLGATALKAVVDPNLGITRARGRWVRRGELWIMPTYHPAALLRNPALKVDAWRDLQAVAGKYAELDP